MNPDEVFEWAVSLTLSYEGGYVNDPRDPGSETNFGISKRAYPELDIKNLSEEQAKGIYYRDYWLAVGAQTMPPALAVVAFDVAVNHGVRRALEWIAEGHDRPVALTVRRMEHYVNLKTLWPIYGRGWSKRAYGVLAAADRLERA